MFFLDNKVHNRTFAKKFTGEKIMKKWDPFKSPLAQQDDPV
jgi:hypothetical protein